MCKNNINCLHCRCNSHKLEIDDDLDKRLKDDKNNRTSWSIFNLDEKVLKKWWVF